MTMASNKERVSAETNAYVARILSETSFYVSLVALGLSAAVTIVAMVYLCVALIYLKKNDNAETANANTAITMPAIPTPIPQLERCNAFLANSVCFSDSANSSFCKQ